MTAAIIVLLVLGFALTSYAYLAGKGTDNFGLIGVAIAGAVLILIAVFLAIGYAFYRATH